MAFEIPKITYSGAIKEVLLGETQMPVGGESSYPFYLFEGEMPNPPRIAMEVYDSPPEGWPAAALEPFEGVTDDPVAWAQRCQSDYEAEMICLQLASIDPSGQDRPSAEATEVVKAVADAVNVPLIVWGCANDAKDSEVLRQVSEACEGKRLIIGPVTEDNYRQVGAAAIAYAVGPNIHVLRNGAMSWSRTSPRPGRGSLYGALIYGFLFALLHAGLILATVALAREGSHRGAVVSLAFPVIALEAGMVHFAVVYSMAESLGRRVAGEGALILALACVAAGLAVLGYLYPLALPLYLVLTMGLASRAVHRYETLEVTW